MKGRRCGFPRLDLDDPSAVRRVCAVHGGPAGPGSDQALPEKEHHKFQTALSRRAPCAGWMRAECGPGEEQGPLTSPLPLLPY